MVDIIQQWLMLGNAVSPTTVDTMVGQNGATLSVATRFPSEVLSLFARRIRYGRHAPAIFS